MELQGHGSLPSNSDLVGFQPTVSSWKGLLVTSFNARLDSWTHGLCLEHSLEAHVLKAQSLVDAVAEWIQIGSDLNDAMICVWTLDWVDPWKVGAMAETWTWFEDMSQDMSILSPLPVSCHLRMSDMNLLYSVFLIILLPWA